MKQYDVVIVGLGPTGGTLANLLALNGFSILILEREKNLYALPRAVHFDDEIMRVFQTIGITKKFLKEYGIKKFSIVLEPFKKNTSAAILSSTLLKEIDYQQLICKIQR